MKYKVEISATFRETFEIEAESEEEARDYVMAQFNPYTASPQKVYTDYDIGDIYAEQIDED
ncbi:hypothetical protein LCGC14_1942950 [marine sediment metagenome]|uniref:DpnD/PcfM-like C-terminal domain-containing protein n=1 Tax=marine sediment metagenome TaxID=412755 RepID=A0A0F9FK06_9ZZZZ